MSVTKRKCSECGTWNEDGEERCKSCDNALSVQLIMQEAHENREEKRKLKPNTEFEKFVRKVKHSKNPLVRSTYFIVYSVWMVYMGILAFFLWLIAAMPG